MKQERIDRINELARKAKSGEPLTEAELAERAELRTEYIREFRASMTGILDPSTADALSSFQMLIGLPITGNLDKHTWKHLALHFPLAANLDDGQPQSTVQS